MNIEIFTLKQRPELFKETISLIETAFDYPKDQNFEIDFHLLLTESNFENCYIAINNNTVIGHLGIRKTNLIYNKSIYPVLMMGGIATAKVARGQGVFAKLHKHVMDVETEAACCFLWSDNTELYNKLNYHLSGLQLEFSNVAEITSLTKTKFKDLNDNDRKDLISLYNKDSSPHINRTERDWDNLSKITTADLYIDKKDDELLGYAFVNKGADLQNIVYEYKNIELAELQKLGRVWSFTTEWVDRDYFQTQYAYFIKIINTKIFSNMINDLYESKICIKSITNDYVIFVYDKKEFETTHSEFLTGVFGPIYFEEIKSQGKTPYISGLDSI